MMIANPKKTASLIVGSMDPEMPPDMGGHDEDLHGLAEDFLAAVHSKDAVAVAEAFRAMFLALESEPHEEEGEPGEAPEVE